MKHFGLCISGFSLRNLRNLRMKSIRSPSSELSADYSDLRLTRSQNQKQKTRDTRKPEGDFMKTNLKRLALLALVSTLSLTAYSQSRNSSTATKTKTVMRDSKHSYVEHAGLRTTEDDKKAETQDGAYWFNRGYAL